MTIQQTMNKLRKIRTWFHFTCAEQALFYELIALNSCAGWKKQFTCTAQHLCIALNISNKTLNTAREKLIQARLIDFIPPTRRKQPGTYSFVEGAPIRPAEKEKKEEKEEEIKGEKEAEKYDNNNIIYNSTNNITIEKKEEKKEKEEERKLFEEFHARYPGTKRAVDTEFENLRKTHRNYPEILPLLLPAADRLIKWTAGRISQGAFAPEYPSLTTWINQRRWEVEFPKNIYYGG